MIPASVIARKRDGLELTEGQIDAFVQGFTSGEIPDYQMSALAMAIYLKGMTTAETVALTIAMLESGIRLEHPASSPKIVDKHSTGGVGDKVSLILTPLLACCEVWVPMISGRGLGPTGGTLDKLESIPGFRTDLTLEELKTNLAAVGCAITGATAELAPADRKLYALRDVTATVASIPLITASIMSKKLAEGLDALVLDVKCGSGAFMKSLEQAERLAQSLVSVGNQMGVRVTALITDMNQPLGRMIGNAVEVNESIDVLSASPQAPADLIAVTLALGGQVLYDVGLASTQAAGEDTLQRHIDSGAGLEAFHKMVAAQSGEVSSPLPHAPQFEITSQADGFVAAIDTQQIGQAMIALGGGRIVATDSIDPAVGVEMLVRIGDPVDVSQPLMNVFADAPTGDELRSNLQNALSVSSIRPNAPTLILKTISDAPNR